MKMKVWNMEMFALRDVVPCCLFLPSSLPFLLVSHLFLAFFFSSVNSMQHQKKQCGKIGWGKMDLVSRKSAKMEECKMEIWKMQMYASCFLFLPSSSVYGNKQHQNQQCGKNGLG